jgi:hypothetical protein
VISIFMKQDSIQPRTLVKPQLNGWYLARKNKELPDCQENTVDNNLGSVSAQFAKVLFNNDAFEVTEVTLPKDALIPMHSGVNRVVYSLSEYKIAYESDGKGNTEKQFKIGDTHWHDACQHALQNIGGTEAKFLVVSYKQNKKE